MASFSLGKLIGLWFATLAICATGAIVLGAAFTLGTGVMLLAASLVPPAVALLVSRDGPPMTVAELLHDVNATPSKKDAIKN